MTLLMSGVSGTDLIPVPDSNLETIKDHTSGVPILYDRVESTNEYAIVYLKFQNESCVNQLSLVVTFRRRMEYHVLTTMLQVMCYVNLIC